jgi:hypothetical protein
MQLEKIQKYQSWLKSQQISKRTIKESALIDSKLRKELQQEFDKLRIMSVAEFNLYQKYFEVRDFLETTSQEDIDEVKSLIYKPKSIDDYLTIEPEVIYVKDQFEIPNTNIHGETSKRLIETNSKYQKHWQILRTLVASNRNDLTLGRAIRFLILDKHTMKYIGFLCHSSSLVTIKCLNEELGWDIDKEFTVGGKIKNTINIQTCVGTQPAGRLFLLGKLCSLLSISDVVLNKIKELYGDTIVEVHTTSLYGSEKLTSQYDNLQPYFSSRLGLTAGATSFKVRDELYQRINQWIYERYPVQYFLYNINKKDEWSNSPYIRDKKNRLLIQAYQRLGFKKTEYTSNHKRGVYHSYIYKNSKQFLSGQIEENELVKAFDNDVESLTKFWKFGSLGQTNEIPSNLLEKYKNQPERLQTVLRFKSGVKGHIEHLKTVGYQLRKNTDTWYEECRNKPFTEIKKKYSKI